MNCSCCGRELEVDAEYCTRCGTSIPESARKQMAEEKRIAEKKKEEEKKRAERERQKEEKKQKKLKKKASDAEQKKAASPVFSCALVIAVFVGVGFIAFNILGKDSTDKQEEKKTHEIVENMNDGVAEVEHSTEEDEFSEIQSDEASENETEEIQYQHTYELIKEDISWQEAVNMCEQIYGGHLVTITSEEEYNEICSLIDDSGLTYIWIGGYMDEDSNSACWITGEDWSFANWYPDEPSWEDVDGTKEYCLCLWNVKYNGEEIGWTFNDQRNDLVGSIPSLSGKVGYICEYETEVTQ